MIRTKMTNINDKLLPYDTYCGAYVSSVTSVRNVAWMHLLVHSVRIKKPYRLPWITLTNLNVFSLFWHTLFRWYVLLKHIKFAFKIYLSLC